MPAKGARKWDSADESTLKWCNKCQEWKPVLTDFYWYKDGRGPGGYCKPCTSKVCTQWNTDHPEQAYDSSRASYDRTLYGVPAGYRKKLLQQQGDACAICRLPPRGLRKLALDHDHKTGRTRGLLCHHCNTALGLLEHDEQRMLDAIEYLRKHRQVRRVVRRVAVGQ